MTSNLCQKMLKTQFPFHGQKVDASLSLLSDSMEISISVKSRQYRNVFTTEYIENMTTKTGNFKKFKIFSEMVVSGFKRQDDTIKVEILTLKDLQKNSDGDGGLDDKLYLILTYNVAFDRVHYPLPLLMEKDIEQDLQDRLDESEKSRLDTVQELVLVFNHLFYVCR
jgi:coiled-coil domain-containing protein 61